MKERFPPRQPNCIGFVYHELGLIPEEKFMYGPYLRNFLDKFTRVSDISEATVVAVVAYGAVNPYIAHVALLSEDKKMITHRDGLGADPERLEIEKGLKKYLSPVTRKVLFFIPKAKVQ